MIKDLYPFSTSDGKAIPLDILRPSGVLRASFVSASGSALLDLGVATPILILRTSEDCFVRFGSIAVRPIVDAGVSTSEQIVVYANEIIIVSPKSSQFSVIGDVNPGVLTIQLIEQWAGIGHEVSRQAI